MELVEVEKERGWHEPSLVVAHCEKFARCPSPSHASSIEAMAPTFLDHDPKIAPRKKLNILLSNGRFPVSLDLARQLHRAGHRVFTVDPMEFHVCKFSIAVKRSWQSPPPSEDPEGYIDVVRKVIRKANIDMIIPMHEEILYLAECSDPQITERLFAAPFLQLYRLHNKWEFINTLRRCGLDNAEARLCTSREDVEALDRAKEWALKPLLGRSSTGVFHLKPGKDIDWNTARVSRECPYMAQEWLKGNRYCTYGIFRNGQVHAFAIYPVLETIDGSSSVYFQATEHAEIKEYALKLAQDLGFTGQMALDLIETGVEEGEMRQSPRGKYRQVGRRRRFQWGRNQSPATETVDQSSQKGNASSERQHRIVAIDCNPRATSGIHLWSGTPKLAVAFSDTSSILPELAARPGFARQTAPGMFMWEHERANAKRYLQHMKRLLLTKDVIWSWKDIIPVLVQPFLLWSYYTICHQKGGIPLSEMFQSDLIWNPGTLGESAKMGLTGDKLSQLIESWVPLSPSTAA